MSDGLVASYKYDSLGRRIEKSVSTGTVTTTARYVYDGMDIIAVLDGNNALVSRITHGAGVDEPLSLKVGTTNYYYHADGLGSIVSLTNDSASIAETIQYQAYGKPVFKNAAGSIISNSEIGNLYSYTAREYDAESGVFYYRARYYSSETGRFIQEDPIGFAGGSANLYGYANNSPLIWADPYGLTWKSALKNLGVGVGVGALSAVVATGVVMGAAVILPSAVVSTMLLLGGGASAYYGGKDLYYNIKQGNWDCVAYEAGVMAGGAWVGGLGAGRRLSMALSPKPTGAPNTWNILDLLAYEWKHAGYNKNLGSLSKWMGTGPTPLSGGGATISISTGIDIGIHNKR